MNLNENHVQCHCCPGGSHPRTQAEWDVSRRAFLALGGVVLGGLTWGGLQNDLAAKESSEPIHMPKAKLPLVVKPILVHEISKRKEAQSWRRWGGIQSAEDAKEEVGRITKELGSIKEKADYQVEFLDVSAVTDIARMKDHPDISKCDLILVYGAGLRINGVQDFGKDVIVFQRWRSGPVYLQYEIVNPRFLRQHTDEAVVKNVRNEDIVTDSLEELNWRFRALFGLKNTLNSKIITIGGTFAWFQPPGVVPELVKKVWNFEYHDVAYDELGKLIEEARNDAGTMERAQKRAEAYLKLPGTKLETSMEFFVNNFVLDDVFRLLMKRVDTNLITVNSCMGPIMSRAKTSACMTLSTLNDDGFLAFCESDFVVIPSGVLLAHISGKPVFLNDPTYPHDGIITLAHCTGPRKMDGKNLNPVRIVTHYESDYGASPKVEVPLGTVTTNIVPDFSSTRWIGLKGTICDVSFRPICRTQFDIRYDFPDSLLADRLRGFHWMTCFGDYRKEIGYALRRVGIQWDNLDEVPTKTMG